MKKPKDPSPSFYRHMEKFLPTRLDGLEPIILPIRITDEKTRLVFNYDELARIKALGIKVW